MISHSIKKGSQREMTRARFVIGSACLLAGGAAHAWGECEHERKLEESMTIPGDSLAIVSGAGDLEVIGGGSPGQVRVTARICASEKDWAEEAGVAMNSAGQARVAALYPDTSGVSGWGNKYAMVDLVVRVPSDLALEIEDSSGDINVNDVGAVSIKDSSGDIEVADSESVLVNDSSGDVELERISGDVTVEQDSSGDIRGRDIGGSVIVARDSSGDIRFRDVQQDFLVERDSSGDVVAQGVGGDFAVLRDGSGDIRHSDVFGNVDIPEER